MRNLNLLLLSSAVLSAALAVPAVAQQSAPSPYQGVSKPPADDSIVTTPDEPQQTAPLRKPSAAVPQRAQPAAPTATAVNAASAPAATPPIANDDSDAVQAPVNQAEAGYVATSSPHLASRPQNPDADIVSVIPSGPNQLPEGTNIRVSLLDSLSSSSTEPGSAFRGRVENDVYKDGRVVIPSGSELRGKVTNVSQGHHIGPSATLRLRPDAVILPDGTAYHLYAEVVGTQARGARTDAEGGIQPSSQVKKNAIEYGAGAGTGAIVGARVAGPTGALVGSLVGAGVVTTHLLVQHPSAVEVPKGSTVTFSLTEPMDLLPTRN